MLCDSSAYSTVESVDILNIKLIMVSAEVQKSEQKRGLDLLNDQFEYTVYLHGSREPAV